MFQSYYQPLNYSDTVRKFAEKIIFCIRLFYLVLDN